MVYKERTPMAFQLAPFRHERRKSRRKIKRAEKNINLIVINEECQLCQSTATPVACSKCYTRLCGECIEDFMGKPVCSLCRDELEKPKRLAKVLMFPPRPLHAARSVVAPQPHRALRQGRPF
jgi:hypothetical protein